MQTAAKVTLATLAAGAALALGVALAGLTSSSFAGSHSGTGEETSETSTTEEVTTTKYRAALTASAEVPKPTGVRPGATGTFTVTLTHKGSSYSVSWRLTFRNLTGRANAGHIHRGKPGRAGPVIVALCGPCRSGQAGKKPVSGTVATVLRNGSGYVNLHTARNKAGEIRGQVKKAG